MHMHNPQQQTHSHNTLYSIYICTSSRCHVFSHITHSLRRLLTKSRIPKYHFSSYVSPCHCIVSGARGFSSMAHVPGSPQYNAFKKSKTCTEFRICNAGPGPHDAFWKSPPSRWAPEARVCIIMGVTRDTFCPAKMPHDGGSRAHEASVRDLVPTL